MPSIRVDAQFERDLASAMRCLRDAEGSVKFGHSGAAIATHITVGRQWLEALANAYREAGEEIKHLEARSGIIELERNVARDSAVEVSAVLSQTNLDLAIAAGRLDRIPRWVRRLFGVG